LPSVIFKRTLMMQPVAAEGVLAWPAPATAIVVNICTDPPSCTQIAAAIGVSYKTIANASSAIKDKLAVGTTADLIRLSIENRRK
jgi:hypothetical protein